MTALRFQTGERHQTSAASLRGAERECQQITYNKYEYAHWWQHCNEKVFWSQTLDVTRNVITYSHTEYCRRSWGPTPIPARVEFGHQLWLHGLSSRGHCQKVDTLHRQNGGRAPEYTHKVSECNTWCSSKSKNHLQTHTTSKQQQPKERRKRKKEEKKKKKQAK